MRYTFGKAEKLKSRKVIEQLFIEGKRARKFPLKMMYMPHEGDKKQQAAFSVPKRIFKLAVTRNRVKRQMREAYRLHKHEVVSKSGTTFAILFVYIHKEQVDYVVIEKAMQHLLKQLPYENH